MLSDFLPDPIMECILSRLPAKYLLRFRGVCKSWRALIDDHRFIDLHIDQSNESNNLHVLQTRAKGGKTYFNSRNLNELLEAPTPLLNDHHSQPSFKRIVGCCKGLLCISLRDGGRSVAIINPSTRRIKDIPIDLAGYQDLTHPTACQYLRDYSNLFGFGYDNHAKEFKIMVLEFPYMLNGTNVIEYSLVRKDWTRIHENIPYQGFDFASSGLFLNGALHWKACHTTNTWKPIILAVDCATGKLHELSFPGRNNGKKTIVLNVFREELCAVFCEQEAVEGWVMKEYGVASSWVKLYNLRSPVNLHVQSIANSTAFSLILHGVKDERIRDLVNVSCCRIDMCVNSLSNVNIDCQSPTLKRKLDHHGHDQEASPTLKRYHFRTGDDFIL